MSKRIGAEIGCAKCGHKFSVQLFRTVWIEQPKNRAMIFEDRINCFSCSNCSFSIRTNFPFLATNAKRQIAVWYEPYPDSNIDRDVANYRRMGPNNFYATAPRVKDWELFKKAILEMESRPIDPSKALEYSSELKSSVKGFINSLKTKPAAPKISSSKLALALSAFWVLISLPVMQQLFEGIHDLMWLFTWFLVLAPVWLVHGWRWLADRAKMPLKLKSVIVVAGCLVSLPYFNQYVYGWHSYDQQFGIQVAILIVVVVIAFLGILWAAERDNARPGR